MKKLVLVLLTLLALAPFAQAMAQTSATPAPVTDAATAQFLATLASPQAQAPADLTPTPLFTQTGCGSGPACTGGQICCFMCGADPGDPNLCLRCVTPIKGRCPLVS